MKKTIILIGGAPTTGKSTLARALSAELGLPWMSTDQIRNIMRTVADERQRPKLFNGGHKTAQSFFSTYSVQEIVDLEIEQGRAVWPGCVEMIRNDYTWPDGFILEGVNILPEMVAQGYMDSKTVKSVFIFDGDQERMRTVIFERGLWGDARSYPDDVKENEVKWATLYSDRIQQDAIRYGLPLVEISKNSQADLGTVIDALGIAHISRP